MNVFMARQPVFNRHLEATAYELLFRNNSLGAFLSSAKAAASGATPPAFLPVSIDRLTNNKRAFVIYAPELLYADIALHLPRNLIGVELPEEVIAGGEAIATARRLKELGYLLVAGPSLLESQELCLLIDILKVNYIDLTRRPEILKIVHNTRTKLWAPEISDNIDLDRAIALGYSYFQGPFLIKPHRAPSRDLNVSRSKYLRIFSELTRSEIDFKSLESLIQQDVAFCYKLLKFVNSAAFGFRETIRSIRQALVLLGQEEVLHWVASLTLREVANNKPLELVTLSVARAKFGELLADEAGLKERAPDLFMIGIFSYLDALLDRPLKEILAELPLAAEVKGALLGENNILGDMNQLIAYYEHGDWANFSVAVAKFKIDEARVPHLYTEAIQWADKFSRM